MRFKYLLLFFGFITSFLGIFFWQKNFVDGFYSLVDARGEILSPQAKTLSSHQWVLGEMITVENEIDFGKTGIGGQVLAEGAFVYDLQANKVIFEKNPHKQLQAASTVKIVTAAVALSRGNMEEEITVNSYPTIVGESSMNLSYGEKFTLRELLYGLLLVSGNDAAEAIAQGLAGKREVFVSWMNEFARRVGAYETNFTTASGLDEEGQFTTAYDLFLMAREVFGNYPDVLEISITPEKFLPANGGHKSYLLKNKLQILDDFPIIGCKPGPGENDKLSFVGLLEKNGKRMLAVFIRTPSIRNDLDQVIKNI